MNLTCFEDLTGLTFVKDGNKFQSSRPATLSKKVSNAVVKLLHEKS